MHRHRLPVQIRNSSSKLLPGNDSGRSPYRTSDTHGYADRSSLQRFPRGSSRGNCGYTCVSCSSTASVPGIPGHSSPDGLCIRWFGQTSCESCAVYTIRTGSAGLFLIFTDRVENGRCQLEIEIIDMNHVRLKIRPALSGSFLQPLSNRESERIQ